MKTLVCSFITIVVGALSGETLLAQTPATSPAPTEKPNPAAWNVRVEALMVNMPEEKSYAFLPELLSADKTAAAVEKLLAAVARKEAVLTGYPIVQMHGSGRGTSESVMEKLYPTQFELPIVSTGFGTTSAGSATTPAPASPGVVSPSAFEKRNVGVMLEVEPLVLSGGDSINVNLQLQRVVLMGVDSYDAYRSPGGPVAKIEQPRFDTLKDSVEFTLRNGQWTLLGVHKLAEGPDRIEFFIIRAVATAVK